MERKLISIDIIMYKNSNTGNFIYIHTHIWIYSTLYLIYLCAEPDEVESTGGGFGFNEGLVGRVISNHDFLDFLCVLYILCWSTKTTSFFFNIFFLICLDGEIFIFKCAHEYGPICLLGSRDSYDTSILLLFFVNTLPFFFGGK